MTGILCALPGIFGASGALDIEIIVVGTLNDAKLGNYTGFGGLAGGSIDDGFFAPKGGAQITAINRNIGSNQILFQLNGEYSNADWTTMRINTTDFARTDASFANSTSTSWTWSSITENPFTAEGTETTVTFT